MGSGEKGEKPKSTNEQSEHDFSHLYKEKSDNQVPIIFCDQYNIKLWGLQKLHPFDAGKWGNVIKILKESALLQDSSIMQPEKATKKDLMKVHSSRYLNSLNWSIKVAQIIEVPPAACLPNFIIQKKVLQPFRYQTGGSILGGFVAMKYGWAINVGGGFHHCSADRGGGFCVYADITLAIKFALDHFDSLKKVLIVDLDAHQGNGHERDFKEDKNVYIFDIYNKMIYPNETKLKKYIRRNIEIFPYTEDKEYLDLVELHLEGSLNEFSPDLVVFNAGTDILEGDCLGLLSVSAAGIIRRDEIVFEKVRSRNIPILMLTSGGYERRSASVIANSIRNLHEKNIISLNPIS